jgi:putative DNA primase/helicase
MVPDSVLPTNGRLSRNGDTALKYAQKGWMVFPCHTALKKRCTCGKPCDSPAKHPVTLHGVLDGTVDQTRIVDWWMRFPSANIGVRTGKVSGIIVLDIDPRHGGDKSWADLTESHGVIEYNLAATTGSGGTHIVFRAPDEVVKNRTNVRPGIDVRGENGYFIAPGSVHISGKRYTWIRTPENGAPLTAVPDWLLQLIIAPAQPDTPAAPTPEQHPHDHPHWVTDALSHGVPEGSRTSTAARLAGYFHSKGIPADIITQILKGYAERCRPPLPPATVTKVVKSITTYPKQQTNHVAAPLPIHETDLGNSRRLVNAHGRDLRFVHPWGKWIAWNGRYWEEDSSGEVYRRARETITALYAEAKGLFERAKSLEATDPGKALALTADAKALWAWALESESRARISAMVGLCTTEPEIHLHHDKLNTEEWLLNCKNGTVDLKTGALLPHRRENFITKCTGIPYDPTAQCPRFIQFLNEIFHSNQDIIGFLQRAIGYALSGSCRTHAVFVLWGLGSNGKSTLINLLFSLLGDYAVKVPSQLFIKKHGEVHPTEKTVLFGVRFAAAIETTEGTRLDEAFLKEATGNDPISARRMREDFWTFTPTHKPFLAVNHKPIIKDTTYSMWRRIHVIPFTVTFADDQIDPDLLEKLRAEASGILNWAIAGCLAYQKMGLAPPTEVKLATSEYRSEMDELAEFFTECVIEEPKASVTTKELYKAYVAWLSAGGGEKPIGKKVFNGRVKAKGYYAKKTWIGASSRDAWQDIKLRDQL